MLSTPSALGLGGLIKRKFASNGGSTFRINVSGSDFTNSSVKIYYTSGTVPSDLDTLTATDYTYSTDYDGATPLDASSLLVANGAGKYIIAATVTSETTKFWDTVTFSIVSQVPSGSCSFTSQLAIDSGTTYTSNGTVHVVTVTNPTADLVFGLVIDASGGGGT